MISRMKGQILQNSTISGILSGFYVMDGQLHHLSIKNPSEGLKMDNREITPPKAWEKHFFSWKCLQLSNLFPTFAPTNLIIVRVVMTPATHRLPAVCQRWALFFASILNILGNFLAGHLKLY